MTGVVEEVLASVGKTFAVMALGLAFRRRWGRDITVLNDLAMALFIPCLAFSVILGQEVTSADAVAIIGAALFVLLSVLVVASLVFRAAGWSGARTLLLPVVFMNCANLPFPILEANYGSTGLGYAVIFYVTVQTLNFSLGVMLLHDRPDPLLLLKTPVFVATLLAVTLLLSGMAPPRIVLDTTELLGDAAIPIILFSFGYSLAGMRVAAWRRTLVAALLRLGGGLAAGLTVAHLLGLAGTLRDAVILMSAMPSAVITVVLARRYGADHELVASVVFTSTLLALMILPLLLLWLRSS